MDGAIHRAAGPERGGVQKTGGLPHGDAKATPAFHLPAKWVFHAVGPRQGAVTATTFGFLLPPASNSASVIRCTIAFPAISTGVYHFPPRRAAHIAVDTVGEHVVDSGVEVVRFVCFSPETLVIYEEFLSEPPRANPA